MPYPLSPRSLRTHARWPGAAFAITTLLSLVAGCQDAAVPTSPKLKTAPPSPRFEEELASPTTGSQGEIAFASARSGNVNIYLLDVATGRTRALTRDKAANESPAWSPDGQKIAFTSIRDGGDGDIYVINADGTGLTRITVGGGWDDHATWSPDGTKIAYTSGSGLGGGDIVVRNADGTGATLNLTNNPAYDVSPAWSPDGSKIAFASSRESPAGATIDDIYVMNADGTGVTRVTSGGGQQPAWSPDGQKIAFACPVATTWQICVTSANGAGSPVNLSNSASRNDMSPSWSSDGAKIAFASAQSGSYDIYVMNADGTGVTRAARSFGNDLSPAWRP